MTISKLLAGTAVIAALTVSSTAQAADYEAQIQELVVSGIVDQWYGGTFSSGDAGNYEPDHKSYLTSGNSGRLSLPLGTNLSIQMDADSEVATNAFKGNASDDFSYSFQGGLHLSVRDPHTGLFGGFVAVGRGDGDDGNSGAHNFHAVGGEAQLYSGDMTFYLQGGWLDSDGLDGDAEDGLHDAFFVRGVGRWFMTPDSRLQGEVAYANGEQDSGDGYDMDVIQWGVRYDTLLMLPLVGNSTVFMGYRGLHADNGCCNKDDRGKFTDHTIMAGFSYHFGGPTMQEFDRVGATLDLPNFGRWVAAGEQID